MSRPEARLPVRKAWWVVMALAALAASAAPGRALSLPDEVGLGKRVMGALRPVGLTSDPSLNAIGERLTAVMARKELPWRFWVVEDRHEYNAFAAPGGMVYITRAYYEKLSDGEAAFVLGHEMAHIDLKHYERQLKRERRADLGSLVLKVLTNARGAWGAAADLGATAYVTHYSRVLEKEADFTGYQYAERAGYDARAAVSALSKLGEQPDFPVWIQNVYATHPILSSREDRLAALGGEEPEEVEQEPPDPGHRLDFTAGLKPLDPTAAIAVRVVGADGTRWENRWRKSLTRHLHLRLAPLGLQVAGDDLMYKPDIGDPVEAARSRGARYLLLVTVAEMKSEATGSEGLGGTPVRAKLEATARVVEVGDGRQVGDEIRFSEEREGADVLAADPETLHTDTVIGGMAARAAGEIAVAAAKAAGAQPAEEGEASAE